MQLAPVFESKRQVRSPCRYHMYLPVPPKATRSGGLGAMLSLVGGGVPGPSTGCRAVRPPGAETGFGCVVPVDPMGVPMVGVEVDVLEEPEEPTGSVLMVPGSSLREGVG